MSKKYILLLCVFLCSFSLIWAKGKSDTNKTKATIQGYVISLGNEPFTYPAIKADDGKKYTIVASEKEKKELLLLQGTKIEFKGKIITSNDNNAFAIGDGNFELSKYKVLK